MSLFVLGVLTTLVAGWLGYHIVRIVETRIKEKEQWNRVLSHPSPSETYWSQHTTPEPSDDEVLRVIRPRSQTPEQR